MAPRYNTSTPTLRGASPVTCSTVASATYQAPLSRGCAVLRRSAQCRSHLSLSLFSCSPTLATPTLAASRLSRLAPLPVPLPPPGLHRRFLRSLPPGAGAPPAEAGALTAGPESGGTGGGGGTDGGTVVRAAGRPVTAVEDTAVLQALSPAELAEAAADARRAYWTGNTLVRNISGQQHNVNSRMLLRTSALWCTSKPRICRRALRLIHAPRVPALGHGGCQVCPHCFGRVLWSRTAVHARWSGLFCSCCLENISTEETGPLRTVKAMTPLVRHSWQRPERVRCS